MHSQYQYCGTVTEEVVRPDENDSDEKKILRIDDPENVAWPTKDVFYIE